jgi:hypothetical protein
MADPIGPAGFRNHLKYPYLEVNFHWVMKRIISMLRVLALVGCNGKNCRNASREVTRASLHAWGSQPGDAQLHANSILFLSGPKVIQTMNEQHEWNW